jgi:hypothetical protein
LEISLNSATIPSDWKEPRWFLITKRVIDRSVVCRQLEHVIARYLRYVCDKNDWVYEGHHEFRPGYSCESQVIIVCQNIADSLEEGVGIDAIIIFSKAFDLVPYDRMLSKMTALGVDSRVVV